jgi:hypothetical protein
MYERRGRVGPMKSFRRNTRGQFVIIAALLISILTLSLVLSIHQINLNQQELRYKPVDELVLGITSDLDRCLTHALSLASMRYNQTWPPGSSDLASQEGKNFISTWVRSVVACYADMGLKMRMEANPETPDVLFFFYWGKGIGISYVYTRFDLDIDAYGFKGWVGQSQKIIVLQLATPVIIADSNSTLLQFHIEDERGYPIQNLTPESLQINASISNSTWTTVPTEDITSMNYLGGGDYSLQFKPQVYNETLGVRLTVVTPEDGIYVSAYYDVLEGEGWGTLWLAKPKEDSSESMLLPWYFLPKRYWNPRYSTLPIPNSNSWSLINVSSTPTPNDILLSQFVNVILWISPESDKVQNITINLSFTYNNKLYEIGYHVFYNAVQEGWYNFSIATSGIDKADWPIPNEPVIPSESIITLTFIIPPQSGNIHVRYGQNYQSRIEL